MSNDGFWVGSPGLSRSKTVLRGAGCVNRARPVLWGAAGPETGRYPDDAPRDARDLLKQLDRGLETPPL